MFCPSCDFLILVACQKAKHQDRESIQSTSVLISRVAHGWKALSKHIRAMDAQKSVGTPLYTVNAPAGSARKRAGNLIGLKRLGLGTLDRERVPWVSSTIRAPHVPKDK